MPDIHHDLAIAAAPERVFRAVSSPDGLAAWWTDTTEGRPGMGQEYRLGFGPDYAWAGVVRRYEPDRLIEWEITRADDDWRGTRVGFRLTPGAGATAIEFWHTGWRDSNAHFRRSSFCWAGYLRLLRRYVELGETVRYADRPAA